MSEFQPLNPTLFSLLRLHFGEVDYVCPGQEISWVMSPSILRCHTDNEEKRMYRKVLASGEEYKINCPFCSDQRKRLYINHRWGVYDEFSESQNLFLCQCFNEQCVDSYVRQKQLRDIVFSSVAARVGRGEMFIHRGQRAPSTVCEVYPPGLMIPLEQLQKDHPHHEAITYLESRGFSPRFLSRRYKVAFCPHSKFSLACNRIVIPLYNRQGKLVNWQARYVGDSVNGVPFNRARVPKFWTCPNAARRLLAYNMEHAVRHDTILIVEGPTDVWRAGPQAMGLMGKSMNPGLQARFLNLLKQYHRDSYPVVCVVLDPEQDDLEKAKGKPHHIEQVVSLLRGALGPNVFGVYLPEGSDPGSLDRDVLRDMVRREASKRKIKASFGRPKGMAA